MLPETGTLVSHGSYGCFKFNNTFTFAETSVKCSSGIKKSYKT